MRSSYTWEHTYRYDKNSQKYCLEFMVTWSDVMMNIRELEKRSAIHFYVYLRQEYVAHITFDKTLLTFYAAS